VNFVNVRLAFKLSSKTISGRLEADVSAIDFGYTRREGLNSFELF
jgi:hypothetical protein